ncbi:MAG: adenylate cyclase regulatory domain-containing protein [Actinomycetota bacterium]
MPERADPTQPKQRRLTREDVAALAGLDAGFVDELLDMGILTRDADGGFTPGAARATRVVRYLERAGLPVASIGEAVRADELDFSFFDQQNFDRFAPLTDQTFRQVSERTGIPLELLLHVRQAIGFAIADADDLMRADEARVVPMISTQLEGGFPPEAIERLLRVFGESLHRMVQAASEIWMTHVVGPMLAAGVPIQQALERASAFSEATLPPLDEAIIAIHHGHQAHVWMAGVYGWAEGALERAGLWQRVARTPAVSFVDLSGYTRLTEERGDRVAAELAAAFSRIVQRCVHERRGTVVKWLGDGVMLFFERPDDGVSGALELVERLPAAGLPPAHVGIDAGPVIVQDGDYFGSTVNVSARIAARAGSGEVLLSARAFDALETLPGDVRAEALGAVELKGVPQPVHLHRLERVRMTT